MGLGRGTNNYAELLALKLLLCFASEKNCRIFLLHNLSSCVQGKEHGSRQALEERTRAGTKRLEDYGNS